MSNVYGYLGKAILGSVFGLHQDVETRIAAVPIYPGDPLFADIGDSEFAYDAKTSAVKGTLSGTLDADDTVELTVNGVVLPTVTVTSEDDTDSVIQKLVDEVLGDSTLQEQDVTAYRVAGETGVIYITGVDTVTASADISGSATLAFVSYTSRRFVGVARHTDALSWKDAVGVYPKRMEVNVVTRGRIAVPLAEDADAADGKPAYVITEGDEAGKFTSVAEGNYDTGGIFRGDEIENGIAYVEVRGSK
jgi:hypothetical protein